MNLRKRPRRQPIRKPSFVRRQFEPLEDRRMMAVLLGQSTFDAQVMGANIEALSAGATVGYGYAINVGGDANVVADGEGQARTAADLPIRNFESTTEMEISSVSKTVTATAILHILQSRPGGLDAALNTRLIDYLPSDWDPGANIQHITLRHLLTHRSGFLEEGNSIGVNFENYGQNTYANLQNLVEDGLGFPPRAADDVYDTRYWNYSYNNANFTLLARVVLPRLINPGLDLTAATFANRDAVSGAIYKEYVQDEIFTPIGVTGADMTTNVANPAKGYNLPTAQVSPGLSQSNLTNTGGAFGWKLTARELATFADAIQRDNSILTAATRQMRDDQQLGWFRSSDSFGEYYSHNGATGGNAGDFRSIIVAMPGEVEASYLMNSDDATLPGGSIGSMLKTAYFNAWTDLTVGGTTGDDNFILRLNNSGIRPSVEVVVNGAVEVTHWIDTFDSLTLNGGLGNDTFTIQGWSSAIDLNINGGAGNDVVNVLPGVRNIETVSGMSFNGGTGNDSITINDQNNPYNNAVLSRMYTVTGGSVARFRQNPALPANPGAVLPVVVGFSGVENLDLTTGGQADVVNVVAKPSGNTRIRTGNGDDVIVVGQTAGNLETVDGLEVEGQAGIDTIRLYDHNKTSNDPQMAAYYDADAGSVSRYMASLGGIAGGTPTSVGVEFSQVENLELTTTDIRDVIRVHATPTGTATFHGGAGNDILNASPNGKNLANVDDLVFNGGAGLDSIVLNDQNNAYNYPGLDRQYEVTASGVTRNTGIPSGQILLPTTIDVGYSSVEELTLRTGAQGDVVDVESVPFSGATIQTGDGDDVVNASPTGRNFETVGGLVVDGGAGADALNIHDENNPYDLNPGGGNYTITPSSVSRFKEHVLFENVAIPVELDFAGMETVSLAAGNQADTFNVQGTGGAATLHLDGNSGADKFNIASPAFATINVQGDFPIFAPGDQLEVNKGGLYAVAEVPGLYIAGSGAMTIGGSTVNYAGIETSQMHRQTQRLDGDFDGNGTVNGEDLTHPTLGFYARYGEDLDGRDFLTWQRNVGNSVQPGGTRGGLTGPGDEIAQAALVAADEDADEPRFDVVAYGSLAGLSGGDADATERQAPQRRAHMAFASDAAPAAKAAKFAAIESALAAWDDASADDEKADAESLWDDAFADFGVAVLAAV